MNGKSLPLLCLVLAIVQVLGACSGGGSSGGGSGAASTVGSASPGFASQAATLALNTPVAGQSFTWQATFDARWAGAYAIFRVDLTAGATYEIAASNTASPSDDPYIYLFDAAGRILAADDNSGGTFLAMVSFRPRATGAYFVALRASQRSGSGRCDLVCRTVTSGGGGPQPTTQALAVGQTLQNQTFEWRAGTFPRSAGDYGQYEMTLSAAREYEIVTGNTRPGTYQDTYLYLVTATGVVLAENDDIVSNIDKHSRIRYSPLADGTYVAKVRTFRQNEQGTCSVTLRDVGPAGTPSRTALPVGASLTGQPFEWRSGTAFAERYDGTYGEYELQLLRGITYTIQTSSSSGNSDDPYLYLYDRSLTLIDEDDDSAGNRNSRLVYAPANDDLFVLRLRAFAQNTQGTTTLGMQGASAGTAKYPDLRTLADQAGPYLYDVFYETSGGEKLRFTNANFNQGDGPLWLRITNSGNTYDCYQRFETTTGAMQERLAGSFTIPGLTGGQHFERINTFLLREVVGGTGIGAVVQENAKTSFCLIDIDHYQPNLAGSPTNSVYGCSNQGISVGWADVYSSSLQQVDLGTVPTGTYWLEAVIDPDDRLLETDNTNNTSRIKVQIDRGARRVTVVP